ncbi:MAG: hypothetical protein IPN29_20065 [Saprospiraceae bacterium]|nr:hypothetical protein [Saprospiraceae bacterium]
MEKYKAPILGLISLGVFWLLSIASSPQVGQTVDCTKLPTPTTKTFTATITVYDLETNQRLSGATVDVKQSNFAAVTKSENECKVELVSSSNSQKNTSGDGIATFTVIETKKSPYDYIGVFFEVSKSGYNSANWSFSTFNSENQTITRDIYLTPKEVYP